VSDWAREMGGLTLEVKQLVRASSPTPTQPAQPPHPSPPYPFPPSPTPTRTYQSTRASWTRWCKTPASPGARDTPLSHHLNEEACIEQVNLEQVGPFHHMHTVIRCLDSLPSLSLLVLTCPQQSRKSGPCGTRPRFWLPPRPPTGGTGSPSCSPKPRRRAPVRRGIGGRRQSVSVGLQLGQCQGQCQGRVGACAGAETGHAHTMNSWRDRRKKAL